MKLSIILFIIFSFYLSNAQGIKNDTLIVLNEIDDNLENTDDTIFSVTDSPALFPKGNNSLGKYLKYNVFYPKNLLKSNLKETVFVRFVIEKDGEVSNLHILSDNTNEFIEEAKKVLLCTPKWIPAKQDNKNVRSYFTVPIKFCPEGCAGW
jgi:protein TonB